MKRIGMRFDDWPEADRAAWGAIFRKGHPLDEAGPLNHYRATSIERLANSYSYWLAWIRSQDAALLSVPPAMRITAERLVAWRNSFSHLAPYTVASRLQSLGIVLHALDPCRPGRQERAVINQATQRAERLGSERKRGRIVDTSVLLEAGLQQFRQHICDLSSVRYAPLNCRDGLMIALLALLPMRRRPFVGLELGRSIIRTADGWNVILNEADLKRGESWESPVPLILHEPQSAYVDLVRPLLAGTEVERQNALWLTHQGGPMDASYVGVRMKS
jgi:hypothetical protein